MNQCDSLILVSLYILNIEMEDEDTIEYYNIYTCLETSDRFLTQPGSMRVYFYFGIIICLIIIYALFLYLAYGIDTVVNNDKLNKTFVEIPILDKFGGWSLSHVITFYIAGLLFPCQWILIFVLGVAWEFVEVVIGTVLTSLIGKRVINPGEVSGNFLYEDKWFDGNLSDIWYNTIGLFLGYWTGIYIRQQRHKRDMKA